MAQLAEAYFHLKSFPVSEEDLQRLGREVTAIAAEAASGLFRSDFEIEVRLESGSLKGWAKVLNGLLVVYGVAAGYKGLKESAVEMVHDAQTFGGVVIEKVLQQNDVPPRNVLRTERRTKTPGKLLRALKAREWLESHRTQLDPAAIRRETARIEALTERVLQDLKPEERRVVRELLEDDAASAYDRKPERHPSPEPPRIAIDETTRQSELFFDDELHWHGHDENKREFYTRFRLSDWTAGRSPARKI